MSQNKNKIQEKIQKSNEEKLIFFFNKSILGKKRQREQRKNAKINKRRK